MVAAVAGVLMVQVPCDQVVDVVAVRHRLVAAAGSVYMGGVVLGTAVAAAAPVGVRGAHRQDVLVVMVAVRAVQMPVVQVVEVAVMDDGDVAAARAVNVIVAAFVYVVSGCHARNLGATGASGEQSLMGISRRRRAVGAHSPAGWRTRKPFDERGAACQRVPARFLPDVSNRRPATTMYMWLLRA